jgi:hypothetical protein
MSTILVSAKPNPIEPNIEMEKELKARKKNNPHPMIRVAHQALTNIARVLKILLSEVEECW